MAFGATSKRNNFKLEAFSLLDISMVKSFKQGLVVLVLFIKKHLCVFVSMVSIQTSPTLKDWETKTRICMTNSILFCRDNHKTRSSDSD